MTDGAERVLHQFKGSQFAEKARWALDYKGLAYREHAVMLGPGQLLLKIRTGSRQVPVLEDGGRIIAGSTAILDHLDTTYPQSPLWPALAVERDAAREVVAWADEKIGKGVRGYLLASARHDPRLRAAAGVARVLGPLMIRLGAGQTGYDSLDRAEEDFPRVLHELKARLAGNEYLVGGAFTAADLSVCALINPIYGPSGSALRTKWSRERPPIASDAELAPVFDWFDRIYQKHRRAKPSA